MKQDYISLKKCLDTNYISTFGPYVKSFEKNNKITKSKYVIVLIVVHQLYILPYLHWELKKEMKLMSSLTLVASANSTIYWATPHFIDSEEITLGADPIKLDNYLKKIHSLKKVTVIIR